MQRILNVSFDRSIDTYPATIIFGDMLPIQFHFIFDVAEGSQPVSNYLSQLVQAQTNLILASQQHLEVQAKRRRDAKHQIENPDQFEVGDYVLLQYPTRPPSKLSPIYRGPMIIIEKMRDNLFQCLDLVPNSKINVHIDRL